MKSLKLLLAIAILLLTSYNMNAQYAYQTRVITSNDLNPSRYLTNNYVNANTDTQHEYYIIFPDDDFNPDPLLEIDPYENPDYVIVPKIVITPGWDMFIRDVVLSAIPDKVYDHNSD